MNQKEYNGWTNYETWNVALWMDNSEGSQDYWKEQAQECYNRAEAGTINTREQQATHDLADAMKDQYEEQSCDMLKQAGQECSVWADLLGAALSEVNWHEIAKGMVDEVEKPEPEEVESEEA